MIGLYTRNDLAHFLRRRELLRQADRGQITADQCFAALGLRPISGGALPVTLSTTQVASTDSPANAPGVWNTNVFLALEDLFGIPNAVAIGRTLLRSVLAGCQLSNDGTTPNTVIDVAAGIAMASDNLLIMDIGAFTGSTAGIWATGSGSNKMDTSTAVAANTWYHVFVIGGGGNATDILFSLSATAPTLPTGYTKQRRIGSFKTATGTTNILAFTQDGDDFYWAAVVADIAAANPGPAAVTRTLTVPTGVRVKAYVFTAIVTTSVSSPTLYLSDLSNTDAAAVVTGAATLNIQDNTRGGAQAAVWTNTSAQIRSRMSASAVDLTEYITTLGWMDPRGRSL